MSEVLYYVCVGYIREMDQRGLLLQNVLTSYYSTGPIKVTILGG